MQPLTHPLRESATIETCAPSSSKSACRETQPQPRIVLASRRVVPFACDRAPLPPVGHPFPPPNGTESPSIDVQLRPTSREPHFCTLTGHHSPLRPGKHGSRELGANKWAGGRAPNVKSHICVCLCSIHLRPSSIAKAPSIAKPSSVRLASITQIDPSGPQLESHAGGIVSTPTPSSILRP